MLECRTTQNCQHTPIIRALGYTNDHVYAETPDWLIGRLSRIQIHKAESQISDAHENHKHGPALADVANGSGEAPPPDEKHAEADVIPAIDDSSRPHRAEGEAPTEPASALGSHGGSPSQDISEVPAPSMTPAIDDSSRASTSAETGGKPTEPGSPGQVLASLASGVRLFRANDGRFFAQVPVGDRFEVYGLRSSAFRDWLIDDQ